MGQPEVLYDAKRHAHTAQGLALSTIHGDLLWIDGGWPGSCHEQDLIELAGLDQVMDQVEVASLLDRGFRGLAKARALACPGRDRRTKDRLTDAQRTFSREQAGLRALVEQSIAHLAGAWALRRWRGLLSRVRAVFRAASALVCLGRWLHRVPSNVTTACGKNHRRLNRSGSTGRPSTASWSNQARATSSVLAVTMIRSNGA